MSEQSEVITPILRTLESLGIDCARLQAGKPRVRGGFMQCAPRGWPDIIGFLPDGRFFGIECKKPKDGSPYTQEQQDFAARAKRAQTVYVLARSISEALRGLGLAP